MTIRLYYKGQPYASIRHATVEVLRALEQGFKEGDHVTIRISDD